MVEVPDFPIPGEERGTLVPQIRLHFRCGSDDVGTSRSKDLVAWMTVG